MNMQAMTQNEKIAFNECISDVNDFLVLFEDKHFCLSNLDMGVMEDGTGFCLETDYICGCGYPRQTAKMMLVHYFMSRDLEDYLNMEIAFPVERVGNDSKLLKKMYHILQRKFRIPEEELYFALEKEHLTVYISTKKNYMDSDTFYLFLQSVHYVTDLCAHMLTQTDDVPKEAYVTAVEQQL